jgi:hypothetical protein
VSTAEIELLWPYDVNYPNALRSLSAWRQLNHYVNRSTDFLTATGANVDRPKVEALDFGSGSCTLETGRQTLQRGRRRVVRC